jgi:hypothetical protein
MRRSRDLRQRRLVELPRVLQLQERGNVVDVGSGQGRRCCAAGAVWAATSRRPKMQAVRRLGIRAILPGEPRPRTIPSIGLAHVTCNFLNPPVFAL